MSILSVFAILIAVLLYGALHSVLASRRVKGVLEPALGRAYRLFFNVVAAVTLLPVFALVALLPDKAMYSVPVPWQWGMSALQMLSLLALALTLWQTDIFRFLGLKQLFSTGSLQPNTLQIAGFYGAMRHPLYFFTLLLIWAGPDMSVNKFMLWTAFTLYLWGGAILEERKLVAQFGEAYTSYQQRVPMMIPWKLSLWKISA